MSEAIEFRMPDVGEGIAEAQVIRWFVEVGDTVREDAPLLEVETDKAVVEIPAPASGTVLDRPVAEGGTAIVGELLVVIGDAADGRGTTGPAAAPPRAAGAGPAPGAGRSATAPVAPPNGPAAAPGGPAVPTDPTGPGGPRRRPAASPRTRRLAVARGIDLAALVGTGPHGRILVSDLDAPVSAAGSGGAGCAEDGSGAFAGPVPPTPVAVTPARRVDRTDEVVEIRGIRRSIARSMTQALTIPHVTEFREVDATALLAARAALRPGFESQGIRLSVFPLLLRAVIRALRRHPGMNATYQADTQTLVRRGSVDLGIATATEDGLLVPVVRDADLLDLAGLAGEVERLADRARTRVAKPEELTGGSFTVTNFGSFGTWLGTPVIRPPEVAIAGFGRITEKVVPVDGVPVVRPVLPIVVATDHRINDGAHLAEFVSTVAEAVAQPLLLLS